MAGVSRRGFLKTLGAAPLSPALLGTRETVAAEGVATRAYTFFNPQEAEFIEAACARLIPSDPSGPGAIEAGVPNFIDKQLGGAWGAGERLYRTGPWQAGTPSQGYQLPFTPAELFRTAIRAINDSLGAEGKRFARLGPEEQDAFLKQLEAGGGDLGGVPSKVFFSELLAMTVQGFFGDPVYGGNKDMVAWRWIGFPGAYANYYELVDKHGVEVRLEPTSLAQNGRGEVHVHPEIPAYLRSKGS